MARTFYRDMIFISITQHNIDLLVGLLIAFTTASGGFWVYLIKRRQSKDIMTKLLMGLAHDKIVFFGMQYINNGYVTKDQYDDLFKYFYEPYVALGGNGTAKKIMDAVSNLELRDGPFIKGKNDV